MLSAIMNLYIKVWCPWCIDAVSWLEQHGFEFSTLDVLADEAAFQRMRKISGQSKTPTLELDNGVVLADFDTKQLEKFLKQHNMFG
ncbi:MAG: glutaredoxin family protein [Chthoniobacterales bacterium]